MILRTYKEYAELTECERETIRQAFKRDYTGYKFRDLFKISRDAFRQLSRESRR